MWSESVVAEVPGLPLSQLRSLIQARDAEQTEGRVSPFDHPAAATMATVKPASRRSLEHQWHLGQGPVPPRLVELALADLFRANPPERVFPVVASSDQQNDPTKAP